MGHTASVHDVPYASDDGRRLMTRYRVAMVALAILAISACGSGDSDSAGGASDTSVPLAKNAALPTTRPPALPSRPPTTTKPAATTKPPAAQPAPVTTVPPTLRPSPTTSLAANGCRSSSDSVLIAVGTTDRYCFTMATSSNTILFGGRACTATETGLYLEGTPETASYCINTSSLPSFRAPSS